MREAIEDCSGRRGFEFASERVVVVGDTEHDVTGAREAGARSIAVATGNRSVAELSRSGADGVVPDLSDRDAMLDLIRA